MIYLGNERVKTEDGITQFNFDLLDDKYSVCYIEDENAFFYKIGVYLLGKCNSKTKAKRGLINYIKKYQPEHLANINEKWIA